VVERECFEYVFSVLHGAADMVEETLLAGRHGQKNNELGHEGR
jgi:hypothetical protein